MADEENSLREQGYILPEEAMPPVGKCVVVLTSQARAVGFLDRSLNWRYKSDHGLMHNVVAWAKIEAVLERF
jgi:hypothetical protein